METVRRTDRYRQPRAFTGSQKTSIIVGAVVVGLIALLLVAEFALSAGRVHPGVTVLGIDFGRKTAAEAQEALAAMVQASDGESLAVTRETDRWEATPSELGRTVDIEATVEQALERGRRGNVLSSLGQRFRLYFSRSEVAPVVDIDQQKMGAFVDRIASEVDVPATNAGLKFQKGQVLVVEGKEGMIVDQAALDSSLSQALAGLQAAVITAPLVTDEPDIQAADTAEAVRQAKIMIGSTVTLKSGDDSWTVTVEQIEAAMDYKVEGKDADSVLVPFISPSRLEPSVKAAADKVRVAAKDATWETDGETAKVVPAVAGKDLDLEKTAQAVDKASRLTSDRVATIVLKETAAKRTTEQAEAMGIKEVLAEYDIELHGSENRVSNIARAIQIIDGTVLAPGAEFSFNGVVGQRTAENGFNTAPVIMAGGVLEDALGGGICQVATTLFNTAFFAGLKITERSNHMLYMSSYPMGRDATVDWGSSDLRFVNDTSKHILIKGDVDTGSSRFFIYGTSDGRKVTYTTSDWYDTSGYSEETVVDSSLQPGETVVKSSGQGGMSCKVTRTITRNGATVSTDVFYSVFPSINRVVRVGPAAPTTTTKPSGSTTTTARQSTTTTEPAPTSTTTTT